MPKMHRVWGLCGLVGALLAAAPVLAQDDPAALLTLDEEFARLAEEVPGFGGLYLDEAGTTHVYLQDTSRAREVQGLGERVEVLQGEYDFRDLLAWKDELRPLLEQRGAVLLDIEERRNRLLFGVERDSVVAFTVALRDFLWDTRVPPESVIVEAVEPFAPVELLTDKIRPVPAGVQISRPINSTTTGVCTLGVNAVRFSQIGFVTASHCSKTRSVVDGTDFFQNLPSSANEIGTEVVDPPFFVFGPCPPGRLCRFSDAAFVVYASPALPEQGKIANPVSCGQGSLLVDPDEPRVSINHVLTYNVFPFLFSVRVRKVGRTTGCTEGLITNTCADVNVQGSIFTMLCQNIAAAAGGPGDSGAPVFAMKDGGAVLNGILWGSSPVSFVYSPWVNVIKELGSLDPL